MSIKIEEYTAIYHQPVVDLVLEIQQQEFGIPITYADQPELANINQFFDKFLLAIVNGKPVGTIGLKVINNFAIIRKMFIAKDFRGAANGSIAQKLLNALEAEIAAIFIDNIYLGTIDRYKAAHRFYEKNNYIEIAKSHLPTEFPAMQVDNKFYHKNLR